MKESAKDFFDRESKRYQQFVKGRDFVCSLRERVNPLLNGRILDVGSGCITDFTGGSFTLYVGMDISLGMLLGLPRRGKLGAVCGDANALPFREGAFDVLIYRAVLHHLNPDGISGDETERVMERVLSEAGRVVSNGGKVIVIEPCLPPLLEGVEKWVAPITQFVMKVLGLPYVFIFSIRRLSSFLQKGGWNILSLTQIKGTGKRWDWIIPILGLPFIKIPRWLSPSKIYVIEGGKR